MGGAVYEVTHPCAGVPERLPTYERVEAAEEAGPDARPNNWLGNLALVARDGEPTCTPNPRNMISVMTMAATSRGWCAGPGSTTPGGNRKSRLGVQWRDARGRGGLRPREGRTRQGQHSLQPTEGSTS